MSETALRKKLFALPVVDIDRWTDGTAVHSLASMFPVERAPLTYQNDPVTGPVKLPLKSLIATQSRVTREGIAEKLADGGYVGDPIRVLETGDGRLYIKDGHHRAHAKLLAGEDEIDAYVVKVREGRRSNPRVEAVGDCFGYANNTARRLDAEGFTDVVVVHGTVQNLHPQPGEKSRYEHAWVEYDGKVWDWQTETMRREPTSIARFYAERRPTNVQRYTPEQALKLCLRTGHHGPW